MFALASGWQLVLLIFAGLVMGLNAHAEDEASREQYALVLAVALIGTMLIGVALIVHDIGLMEGEAIKAEMKRRELRDAEDAARNEAEFRALEREGAEAVARQRAADEAYLARHALDAEHHHSSHSSDAHHSSHSSHPHHSSRAHRARSHHSSHSHAERHSHHKHRARSHHHSSSRAHSHHHSGHDGHEAEAHSVLEIEVREEGALGFGLENRGGSAVVRAVDADGLAAAAAEAAGGALHVGLELREVNGHVEEGYEGVCIALRHARRPVTLAFANVHGNARRGADGALHVTVESRGALGVTFGTRGGEVFVRSVAPGGSAHAASHGALRAGMRLEAVDGVVVAGMRGLADALSASRPVELRFGDGEDEGAGGGGAAGAPAGAGGRDGSLTVHRATPDIAARVEAARRSAAAGEAGAEEDAFTDVRVVEVAPSATGEDTP